MEVKNGAQVEVSQLTKYKIAVSKGFQSWRDC